MNPWTDYYFHFPSTYLYNTNAREQRYWQFSRYWWLHLSSRCIRSHISAFLRQPTGKSMSPVQHFTSSFSPIRNQWMCVHFAPLRKKRGWGFVQQIIIFMEIELKWMNPLPKNCFKGFLTCMSAMAKARLRLKPAAVKSIQAASQQLLRQIPDVIGAGRGCWATGYF